MLPGPGLPSAIPVSLVVEVGRWRSEVLNAPDFVSKLSTELPYNPVLPLPGVHPKELKTLIETKAYTRMSSAA
jgi:hypothetical protein